MAVVAKFHDDSSIDICPGSNLPELEYANDVTLMSEDK